MDKRAQARYMKAGCYPRLLFYHFARAPRSQRVALDLHFVPMVGSAEHLQHLERIDQAILGFRRQSDHQWLIENRRGFLYRRDDRVVGYGYLASGSLGPCALMEAGDFSSVLAHAESEAQATGAETLNLQVPACNQVAIETLLAQGYRIDDFVTLWMTNEPFGQLQRYIATSPAFFL